MRQPIPERLYVMLTSKAQARFMASTRAMFSWLIVVALLGSSLAEPLAAPPTEAPVTLPEPSERAPEPGLQVEAENTGVRLSNTVTPAAPASSAKPVTPKKPSLKPIAPRASSARSIVLEQTRVRGIDVKIVRVNLWDRRVFVSPVMPSRGLGKGGERFDTLVSGSSAIAIVNGGYFHPDSFSLTGDLVVRGRHLTTQGPVRTALGITSDGRASVTAGATSSNIAWREFETAISNGPWVLRQGKIMVYPREEGYTDRGIERPSARSAVGITSQRKLFIVSTREKLNLYDLAKLMKALGARDSIALDGGSSVGLAWKGKVLIRPARKIAYGIGVYVRP